MLELFTDVSCLATAMNIEVIIKWKATGSIIGVISIENID